MTNRWRCIVKGQCHLIWLENLNLRGSYKAAILAYISEQHPELTGLYHEIYRQGNRRYWEALDSEIRACAERRALEYLRDDDSMKRPFEAPPVIVNFFYHEAIKKSAKQRQKNETTADSLNIKVF